MHDDLVMSLVLFAWLSSQDFFRDLVDINTIGRIKEINAEQLDLNLMPFGFVDTGNSSPVEETHTKNWLWNEEEVETLNDF